jgi:hypothetical protein
MHSSRSIGLKLFLAVMALALMPSVAVLLARGTAFFSPAHAEATPQAISAVDLATRWVYALKRGDTRMLDSTSAYPFELRIQKAPCACAGGKARDSARLAELLGELMKSEDVKALEVTSADAKEVFQGALPGWAKSWGKGVPKGARLVLIESQGGVTYTITYVLVIAKDQVRALWLNAAKG